MQIKDTCYSAQQSFNDQEMFSEHLRDAGPSSGHWEVRGKEASICCLKVDTKARTERGVSHGHRDQTP